VSEKNCPGVSTLLPFSTFFTSFPQFSLPVFQVSLTFVDFSPYISRTISAISRVSSVIKTIPELVDGKIVTENSE
jgi:hypothetical protein